MLSNTSCVFYNGDTPMVSKVDILTSNIAIFWTPIFEWYVIRCGSKNRHQNYMSLKEIGLGSKYAHCSRSISQHN